VVTTFGYGAGFAEMSCLLYDPATKRWASPTGGEWNKSPPEGGSCTGFALSADGMHYAIDTTSCVIGKTEVTCGGPDDRTYIGWVDLPAQ
jgi:hypothetical protein